MPVRTLTMVVGPHKDGGLQLTVQNKRVETDDEGAQETLTTKASGGFASDAALGEGVNITLKEYLATVKSDHAAELAKSPIGRAIKRAGNS